MNTHLWMSETETFVPDELVGEGWPVHHPETAENFSVERDAFLWLRPNSPLAQRRSIESVIQMYQERLNKPRPRGLFGWLKAKWDTFSYGRCHHGVGFEGLCPTCADEHQRCIAFLQSLKKRVISLPRPPSALGFTEDQMTNGARLYANITQNQGRMAEDIVMKYGQALAKREPGEIARSESRLFRSKREIFIAFKVYFAWRIQNNLLPEAIKEKFVMVLASLHHWVADADARALNETHRLRKENMQAYHKLDHKVVEQLHSFQDTFCGVDLFDYADRFITACTKVKGSSSIGFP